jgi:hypothetical protein
MSRLDFDDRIQISSFPDPNVVEWPHGARPITSRFIHSRNQPPPPVLATTIFPPPEWPLDSDDWTIMPVVGPIMALTEEQVETPPGFGRFPPGFRPVGIEERREERLEERGERREDRRRGRRRRDRDELGERREGPLEELGERREGLGDER